MTWNWFPMKTLVPDKHRYNVILLRSDDCDMRGCYQPATHGLALGETWLGSRYCEKHARERAEYANVEIAKTSSEDKT